MTRMKLGEKALVPGMDHARTANLKAHDGASVDGAMRRAGLPG